MTNTKLSLGASRSATILGPLMAVSLLAARDARADERPPPPKGWVVVPHGAGWVSEAVGLDQLVAGVHPKVCFFGHHHTRVDGDVAGVRCIGLNKVMRPGNLVAIDIEPRGEWSILGEWPKPAKIDET
jgi:hypothetical protein